MVETEMCAADDKPPKARGENRQTDQKISGAKSHSVLRPSSAPQEAGAKNKNIMRLLAEVPYKLTYFVSFLLLYHHHDD